MSSWPATIATRRRRAAPGVHLFAGALAVIAWALLAGEGRGAEPEVLVLEATIPLEGVSGRIDHMAVDLGRGRVMVAELGNGSVDAIDLASRRLIHRIAGLAQPQGIAFAPGVDLLVVASAGDGSVRFYRGDDFTPAGRIDLGDDADNVRLEPRSGRVVVGYGSGGLALIDPASRAKTGEIVLQAHPEGFQLTPDGARAFVNVPDAGQIAVVDLAAGRQVAAWRVSDLRANFPLAIDGAGSLLAAVFRNPARIVFIDTSTGAPRAELATCADADDVFFDAKRRRAYVSCGAGAIDVFEGDRAAFRWIRRVPTAPGARTALFVPELDRLFVAQRAGLFGGTAKILIFRPLP
jgi:hypothetical protein